MKTKWVFILMTGVFAVFVASAMQAGTTAPDVIRMQNKAYTEHTKGIVAFSHKKHAEDYNVGCGQCHHDENNKPLDGLKAGDPVQSCIACHKIPGEPAKGKDAPKLTKQQRLEYHAEAIHDSCRDCHKKFNAEKGLKSKDPGYAPTTCSQCHPKN